MRASHQSSVSWVTHDRSRSTVVTALVAAVLAAAIAPAAAVAAPREVRQLEAAALPRSVKAKGKKVEQVWKWTEEEGGAAGLAVFSSTDRLSDGHVVSRKLFVQLYRGKGAALKQLRLIQDGIDDCEFDMAAEFLPGSVTVTDQDTDGKPELTFAYDLTCTSDVSPSARKLLVLEGTAKHILRGNSRVDVGDNQFEGGDYKAEGFQREAALQKYAEQRWQALLVARRP